jgi:hypothetical protein
MQKLSFKRIVWIICIITFLIDAVLLIRMAGMRKQLEELDTYEQQLYEEIKTEDERHEELQKYKEMLKIE